MEMLVGVDRARVVLLGDSRASLKEVDGRQIVEVAPHEDRVRYKVLISASTAERSRCSRIATSGC